MNIEIKERAFNDNDKNYYIMKRKCNNKSDKDFFITDNIFHDGLFVKILYLHRNFRWDSNCGNDNFYNKHEALDHALKYLNQYRYPIKYEIYFNDEIIRGRVNNNTEFIKKNEMVL